MNDRNGGHDPAPDGAPAGVGMLPTVPQADSPGAADRSPSDQRVHEDVKRRLFHDSQQPSTDEPGRMLAGRYRLSAFLGQGGMGRVYRAHDLVLDEEVAIKFLPEHFAREEAHLQRFVREVRTARQVSHPNVCRVHDIANDGERPFLSMEYIAGEDVGTLLARIGRLERDKALELAHELCSGLGALHARGILHRDLKPSNVMIDGRGRVRITDFGLAALDCELSTTEIQDGTPAYQAPEQRSGEVVSVRSDIYALGILLFEMFSGQRWTKLPHSASLRAIEAEARLRSIDGEVAQVVRKCLDPDPEQRPASALEVAAELPGGDPLALAVATGQLLSPEAIANVRTGRTLTRGKGLAMLLTTMVMLLVLAGLRSKQGLLDGDALPPDVLVHRSKELLEQAGYDRDGFDHEARFIEYDFPYARQLGTRVRRGSAWLSMGASLEVLRKAPTSPLTLTYRRFSKLGHSPKGAELSIDDPEPKPGDAIVELDIEGRLLKFLAAPEAILDQSQTPTSPADFEPLLAAVDVPFASLESTDPRLRPPVFADEHRAWLGRVDEIEIRIEAAALLGRPVWFEVDRLDRLADKDATSTSNESSGPRSPSDIVLAGALTLLVLLVVAVIVVGFLKVVRTLRRPEGDSLGARRIAYALAGAYALSQTLTAQGIGDIVNPHAIATVVALGFTTWILYLIVEPYGRLRLPRSLISWNRLLQGRWRDPLIGHHVLLGVFGAVLLSLLHAVLSTVPDSEYPENSSWQTLLGARFALGEFVDSLGSGVTEALSLYLVLSIAETVFRRRAVAVAVCGVVFTAIFVGILSVSAVVAIGFLSAAFAFIFYALRFGLLATAVFAATMAFLNFPSDILFRYWWSATGLLPLLAVTALAFFGYAASTAGQRRSPA